MMRADRLLSLMILLQTKGRMTASALAEELEVSERTIYRDIEVLSAAGIPVYSDPGKGGGYSLIDNYQTRLTGLTTDEVQALFMLNMPKALEELGMSQKFKAAMLKLTASLTSDQQQNENRTRQRFYLDQTFNQAEDVPLSHLQLIHKAVWEDSWIKCRLKLPYNFGFLDECLIAPYGLVASANGWFFAGFREGYTKFYPVERIVKISLLPEKFSRPDGFKLAIEWRNWVEKREIHNEKYYVKVRVQGTLLDVPPVRLHQYINDPSQIELQKDSEWISLDLVFDSFEAARWYILGLGGAIEVFEPKALRYSVCDFAAQTLNIYSK
jgi:predicted DNA-binding transcriptional regulator YafY